MSQPIKLKEGRMSKTHKVSIVLGLAVLTALGVSLIRGWPPLAIAAGQEQTLEADTLFFVSGPQASIQRVAASEPRRLAEQAVSAAANIPLEDRKSVGEGQSVVVRGGLGGGAGVGVRWSGGVG
ncbi:MAG: hypothetical protein NZ821_07965, partial [Gloeomargarita sp. SKYB31]|nr:hypothetical protein [Gloeomargarita sp. SKYB31]